jgi:hypothetical protein
MQEALVRTWAALAARISLFAGAIPSPPPSALDIYKAVWGIEPDRYQKQANPLMPNVAQGTVEHLIVNCTTQLQRTDLNLSPVPRPGGSFALIADTVTLHKHLSQIIAAVGQGVGQIPVSRVATFVHFVSIVDSFASANRILIGSMPEAYRMSLAEEEDFSLQVNLPLLLQNVSNVRMNFVTKWSADRFQVFNIVLPPVSGAAIPAQLGQGLMNLQPIEYIAASVTFDNSTAPMQEALPTDRLELLLKEGLAGTERMQRECGMQVEGF